MDYTSKIWEMLRSGWTSKNVEAAFRVPALAGDVWELNFGKQVKHGDIMKIVSRPREWTLRSRRRVRRAAAFAFAGVNYGSDGVPGLSEADAAAFLAACDSMAMYDALVSVLTTDGAMMPDEWMERMWSTPRDDPRWHILYSIAEEAANRPLSVKGRTRGQALLWWASQSEPNLSWPWSNDEDVVFFDPTVKIVEDFMKRKLAQNS